MLFELWNSLNGSLKKCAPSIFYCIKLFKLWTTLNFKAKDSKTEMESYNSEEKRLPVAPKFGFQITRFIRGGLHNKLLSLFADLPVFPGSPASMTELEVLKEFQMLTRFAPRVRVTVNFWKRLISHHMSTETFLHKLKIISVWLFLDLWSGQLLCKILLFPLHVLISCSSCPEDSQKLEGSRAVESKVSILE